MSEEESVKVAVRVRPFNKRERQRNAGCIIQMSAQSTSISNPDDPEDVRTFTFDYSYWSHDGAKELENGYFAPTDEGGRYIGRYIGQEEVFQDVGVGILKNAWEGYNTSLFAYGQTGSGKSWSVVGYGANKGIVPRFCEELFKEIDIKKQENEGTEYEVVFSMLEIYNERVHDLLNPKIGKTSLPVRQHPKKGFYADGLTITPVKDYKDIEFRMEEGTKNRTIAATNMNATSSRAHTIVGVTFIQKSKNATGDETAKSSVVNLVDLAGSERADSTGATGDRLKEGAAINQSLSSLGNCIAALAERSEGKKVRVPYRDSVLTKLLKNALGGNSKTIMIAALSPADINYEETLSTLRYADRAKQIKTKATVNEDPTAKLIRDLQEENEKLKALLASEGRIEKLKSDNIDDDANDDNDDGDDDPDVTEEEMNARIKDELAARMVENDRMMKEMEEKWEEKLAAAQKENQAKDQKEKEIMEERKISPHLYNLNADPMLTGMIIHLLKIGSNKIGRFNTKPEPEVSLRGINIMLEHGEINITDRNECQIKSFGDARILLNGEPISSEGRELHHNDRILIGSSQLYVFTNPKESANQKNDGVDMQEVSYETAQAEIAKWNGSVCGKKSTEAATENDNIRVNEDLSNILPEISEANGMSEELDKKVQFEAVILSGQVRGKHTGGNELFVKVTQLETGYMWFWTKEKFINRKYVMQEMFEDFQTGESWNVPLERDPFIESPETENMIGVCEVFMKSIMYRVDLNISVPVVDYRGLNVGALAVSVLPCTETGQELREQDAFIETPNELEGRRIDFKICLKDITGLPKRYTDVYCRYDIFTCENIRSTVEAESINVTFEHSKQITIDKCSKKILDFLASKPMVIQIWGKQKPGRSKPINNAARFGKTTREIMKQEILKKMQGGKVSKKTLASNEVTKNNIEALLLQKRMETMQQQLFKIKKLCNKLEKKGDKKVSILLVREILGRTHLDEMNNEECDHDSNASSSSSDESDNEKHNKTDKKSRKKLEHEKQFLKSVKVDEKERKEKDLTHLEHKSKTCVLI